MFNVNNKLFENIISLFSIKGLEYLLAFITFPYLTRVLEVEKFGAIVFAQGIMQYFVLFTDYGFNLLAPREIAKNDETKKRGKVFAAIFYVTIPASAPSRSPAAAPWHRDRSGQRGSYRRARRRPACASCRWAG